MIKGLKQVAAYLYYVIVLDYDPVPHVRTIRSLFERLRKHNLKLSPSKGRLGATDANFLGHYISPAGLRPNAEKGRVDCMLGYDADMMTVEYCRGFQ